MVEKKAVKKTIKKKVTKKKVAKKAPEKKEVKKVSKKVLDNQSKILKNILLILGIIIVLIIASYIYIQTLKTSSYKDIEFRTANLGTNENPLIMYETLTLADSNDGTNVPFGFRIRTKPSSLKRMEFEGLKNFELMKINGYRYEEEFNCDGDATIAMENLKRLFVKTGMDFFRDNASTCDPEGRYNYFTLKYGEETMIKEVGNKCYDIIIKQEGESCEILPATEKLMLEVYNKYLEY